MAQLRLWSRSGYLKYTHKLKPLHLSKNTVQSHLNPLANSSVSVKYSYVPDKAK